MGAAEKEWTPGSLEWVRDEIGRRLRPTDGFAWVRETFPDRAIVEIEPADAPLQLYEVPYTVNGQALALGTPTPVTVEYVALSEGGPRLTGPIVGKDAARQIAYAPALVPGEPDGDGEELTAEKVEEVAHGWLAAYRALDADHDLQQRTAYPVESYLEPQDRVVELEGTKVALPAGSWTLAVKVDDDELWQSIVDGDRTGLSIMAVPAEKAAEAAAAAKRGEVPDAAKRTTLADVGGGDPNGPWEVPLVSVVDRPAVPKAKFYALKAGAPPRSGLGQRLKRAVTGRPDGAGKAGRRVSDGRLTKLRNAKEVIDEIVAEGDAERATESSPATDAEGDAMDEQQAKTIAHEAAKAALAPVEARLDKLDGGAAKDGDGGGTEGGTEGGTAGGGDGTEGTAGGGGTEGDGGGNGAGDTSAQLTDQLKAAIDEAVQPVLERLETVEKRTAPGSQQPDDHGAGTASVKDTGRDALGRKRTPAS